MRGTESPPRSTSIRWERCCTGLLTGKAPHEVRISLSAGYGAEDSEEEFPLQVRSSGCRRHSEEALHTDPKHRIDPPTNFAATSTLFGWRSGHRVPIHRLQSCEVPPQALGSCVGMASVVLALVGGFGVAVWQKRERSGDSRRCGNSPTRFLFEFSKGTIHNLSARSKRVSWVDPDGPGISRSLAATRDRTRNCS